MKTLVVAEHEAGELNPVILKVIFAATQLKQAITLLIVGSEIENLVSRCQTLAEINEIIAVDDPIFKEPIAENYANIIAHMARDYSHILAPANTFGKDILPRAAALCDCAMVSEVTEIIDTDTFVKPIYAGNAFATVKTLDRHRFLTIRGIAFDTILATGGKAKISKLANPITANQQVEFLESKLTVLARPELSTAKIIVSGGRGLQNKENFSLIEGLADKLGAGIGASRAAVDAGFVPNDYQVGQTGKVVAPELYFAIGISGAIQHLAGMKDSKVIVAINKDPDAPIFKIATYGLVGDLFKIIPELTDNL